MGYTWPTLLTAWRPLWDAENFTDLIGCKVPIWEERPNPAYLFPQVTDHDIVQEFVRKVLNAETGKGKRIQDDQRMHTCAKQYGKLRSNNDQRAKDIIKRWISSSLQPKVVIRHVETIIEAQGKSCWQMAAGWSQRNVSSFGWT